MYRKFLLEGPPKFTHTGIFGLKICKPSGNPGSQVSFRTHFSRRKQEYMYTHCTHTLLCTSVSRRMYLLVKCVKNDLNDSKWSQAMRLYLCTYIYVHIDHEWAVYWKLQKKPIFWAALFLGKRFVLNSTKNRLGNIFGDFRETYPVALSLKHRTLVAAGTAPFAWQLTWNKLLSSSWPGRPD